MHHTKTLTEARPRRGVQVVLPVPSWRARSLVLAVGLTLLLLLVIRLIFAWNSMEGGFPRWIELIWLHSFLSVMAPPGVILAAGYCITASASEELNRKRQQAARYNLTAGAWERALVHTPSDVPALPDVFTLASERNWPATLIAALVNSLLAIIIGAGVYGNWVETFPLVQHGAPLFWVILNTGVNVVLFLGVVSACLTWLIFSPRQQISATREGLFCRLGWRTSFMPWQQASLFAVIGQVARRGQQPVLIYELASKDTIIRWPSSNRFVSAYWRKNLLAHLALSRGLVRRSPAEACAFAQRVEMLNIIVAERSGLALYDLRQESGEGY